MREKIKILLVEDNPADVELTRENLDACKIIHDLYVAMDGQQAMDFLRKEGEFSDKPRPDLILMDLNMPRKDGRQVLKEIKDDPQLRRIPIVVLTLSNAEIDIVKSYDLHASAYVVKPVDLVGFGEIVRGINDFWFSVVRYPPE
ncbi:response regulator [bacterium]|nr:response regulator [bacterium]